MIYDPSLSSRLATRMVAGAPAAIVALGLLTLTSCGGGDGDSSSSTPRVESILYSFKGGTADGSASQADLIQASDGDFYGTTFAGGTYGLGTVFRVTPAGVETALWSFGSAGDGASPQAALIQASDGNFYGTTTGGGTNRAGTAFRLTPAGVETVLWSFGGAHGEGANPVSGLIQASDGSFYGTTMNGGAQGSGTVFRLTPAGSEAVLWSFGGTGDGAYPQAGLMQASDGNFYGTTKGALDNGAVYRLTPAGVETVLWTFGGTGDGFWPFAGLIQASDGNFYGTTEMGGANNAGTVFKVTPAGVETVLWSFGGGNDGVNPWAKLIQASDGNFYGTTEEGGVNNTGTIFKLTPSGVETVLHSFGSNDTSDGVQPFAGLIQASDGTFYGTTIGAGANFAGTVFKY